MAPGMNASAESAQSIKEVTGTGIAVRGNDIDTDRIIPARYLKCVTFDGIGEFAFQDVRVDENGARTNHPFNDPKYKNASILLVNRNFGCGSSREHAPQALLRWGIKAVVGESFAEIFAGNCNALGIPAVTVSDADVKELMSLAEQDPGAKITIDLVAGSVTTDRSTHRCSMPESYRDALVGGIWDSTAVLLQNREGIDQTAKNLPYIGAFR